MTLVPFLRPRLIGARFEGRGIPLEFLKDLSVLEEMVVEVAKSEFLKEHSDRKRAPRGFAEGMGLKLTGIEEGSAIPVISLALAPASPLMHDIQVYFERARESLIKAIEAAEENQSVTSHLPEKILGYFDRIGRNLREGEAVEFSSRDHPKPARLTRETRRRLVLASSRVQEITEATTLRGTVPEADQGEMTFHIRLVDGRKVRAPMIEQHLDSVLEAFNGYKTGLRIMIQGTGRFNRSDRLLGFEAVEHVTILDSLDVPARLDELRSLKSGWLEGQGKPLCPEGLDWLSEAFLRHYPDGLPLPFLYPTPEGGIQVEWSLGQEDITVEIDLSTHVGQWHALSMASKSDRSHSLDLDDPDAWKWIVDHVLQATGFIG